MITKTLLKRIPVTVILTVIWVVMWAYANHIGPIPFLNLVYLGAQHHGLVLEGDWYRLFVSGFLHLHFLHLLFNVWALWILGQRLEPLVGAVWMITIWSVGTIYGNVISFLFSPHLNIGASGGLCAILGALVVIEKPIHILSSFDKGLLWFFLISNVTLSFWIPFLDMGSHLGGTFIGLLIGGIWIRLHLQTLKERYLIHQMYRISLPWRLMFGVGVILGSLGILGWKWVSSPAEMKWLGVSLREASKRSIHSPICQRFVMLPEERPPDVEAKVEFLFRLAHVLHMQEKYDVAELCYRLLFLLDDLKLIGTGELSVLTWMSDWMLQVQERTLPNPAFTSLLEESVPVDQITYHLTFWKKWFEENGICLGTLWVNQTMWILTSDRSYRDQAGAYVWLSFFQVKEKIVPEDKLTPYERFILTHFKPQDVLWSLLRRSF